LRRHRRVIFFLIQGYAEAARLGPQDAVENDRGYAQANRRPNLRHPIEQRTRNALLVGQRYLGDEQCSRCEREVHTEGNEAGRGEAKGPVWCAWINHGKKYARTSSQECARGCEEKGGKKLIKGTLSEGSRGRKRTNYINDVDAPDGERDDNSCRDACKIHGQHAEHSVNRG
jgi:hypothetical protein